MEEQSITVGQPEVNTETIETSVELPIASEPSESPVEVTEYKTTLRHFTLDEIKQFAPNTVINFGGIVYMITDMSQSRMILKPIGTRERVTKKTAGV